MGTLFGFVVGFVVGARIGSEGFDEVVQAYDDIRNSREFNNLLAVVRDHTRRTAAQVIERFDPRDGEEAGLSTLEKAMRRAGQVDTT